MGINFTVITAARAAASTLQVEMVHDGQAAFSRYFFSAFTRS